MKFLLIILSLINMAHATNWDGKVFNVQTNTEISSMEFYENLSHYTHIILGEKHYSPAVQLAQANTIKNVVLLSGKNGAFTTGWEFLNVTAQVQIDQLFSDVKNQKITSADFLNKTQNDYKGSLSYAPIIDVTANLGGKLLGMNLSRAEKTPVTEKGIGAIDPKLLPPNFDYGTKGYFERFAEQMKGHATPEQVTNYYASQCLVDDTIAYHLLKDSNNELNFLIAGSFHTDFYDGAVNRLKVRNPGIEIVTIKIIDASDYEESELMNQFHDDQYGNIADYVIFVNNPTQNFNENKNKIQMDF